MRKMKWYYHTDNGHPQIELSTHAPIGEWYEIDDRYPWAEVYDLLIDEDGSKALFISEEKLANRLDSETRREHELRKQK